ncbi:dual OB domain-containing protein [Gracilimonas sp. BCB1]|uniref:dual OB domain-containing protein n=1 Tax=Gracilimonas sp. BCB1 TaxID=3152362 RepID=UPI0032D8B4AA
MPKGEIIVVSNTRMQNNSCVGGFIIDSGRPVRLMDQYGNYQPQNHQFEIGGIYEMEFNEPKATRPPHNEHIFVTNEQRIDTIANADMTDYLINDLEVNVWEGGPDKLFDGELQWTGKGTGYINDEDALDFSTGFWISDKDLEKYENKGNGRYQYVISRINYGGKDYVNQRRIFKYVGHDAAIDLVPAGTLLRVSLARWWDTNGLTEERCYLQLSGWYGV